MGLTLDKTRARSKFEDALALARSAEPIPEKWTTIARRVGGMSSATFTPMLGTALLAKATDERIDAFSLQAATSHKGYSARGLAKDVLVPGCVAEGIDLRTRGAEPLNNSPLYREPKVHRDLKVSDRTRAELEELCDALEQVDFLTEDLATPAFAAFLRVRIEDGRSASVVPIGESTKPLSELVALTLEFTNADLEGGKRGQALVAACLDLVHDDVRSAAINDPSVHTPGDAVVHTGDAIVLAAEAKQKPVSPSEVLQFADRLATEGIGKGLYLAIAPNQPTLPTADLSSQVATRHGVALTVITEPSDLLTAALIWSSSGLDQGLRRFPTALMERLVEFDCDQVGIDAWASHFHVDDEAQ